MEWKKFETTLTLNVRNNCYYWHGTINDDLCREKTFLKGEKMSERSSSDAARLKEHGTEGFPVYSRPDAAFAFTVKSRRKSTRRWIFGIFALSVKQSTLITVALVPCRPRVARREPPWAAPANGGPRRNACSAVSCAGLPGHRPPPVREPPYLHP